MIAKLDPVKSAKRVAGMVTAGYVTEEYAVAYLAENAGQSDVALLREGVIRAQADPDVLPLVVALLERAAHLAANPPPRRPPLTTT